MTTPRKAGDPELRRRIVYLMLFRVILITLVLGATIAIHYASPLELALPSAFALFAVIAITYGLTIVYAFLLGRVSDLARFADLQLTGDLLVTTALVHVTGGVQSAYTFLYPLSIIGAALLRYRRGAVTAAGASVALFAVVSLAGWMQWLPLPQGQRIVPWDLSPWELARVLVLNAGAFVGVAFLASYLGQALAQSRARLEAEEVRTADLAAMSEDIIRCLSSGLITVSRDGKVLVYNDAAEEILGLRRDDVLGRPLADVAPDLAEYLADLSPRDRVRRGELILERPGGQPIPLGVSVSPLTDHKNEVVGRVAYFQDLSEFRSMEEQMQRAQRLATIGELSASVAHEIRNPLASISGSMELLKKSAQTLGEEDATLMDIVLREVGRLNSLVNDLLDYARPKDRVPLQLDLRDLVAETVRVFEQDRSSPGVTITLETPDEPLELEADASQLRQVVWNLLRNAAEAMDQEGSVEVRLARDGGDVVLTVADTGRGIPEGLRSRIFDPFFTTKAQGTGLGLATVQRIVAEHQGSIDVDSIPEEGTRFTIRLPGRPTGSPARADAP